MSSHLKTCFCHLLSYLILHFMSHVVNKKIKKCHYDPLHFFKIRGTMSQCLFFSCFSLVFIGMEIA